MRRNVLHFILAYLKHWLLKEDRYSQQSPFIFSVYQGALDLLKKEKPFSKMEKIALLAAYFCQITPANHLLEMGFGNETITKRLIQEKLFKIPATKSLGQETEAAIQQIQRHTSLDFVLIHPQLSADYLQEALTLLVPRMQGQGILLLVGIHKNKGIHAHWKKLQADPRIPLTLDFFDFGVAFLSYSGPKTNVSLSY